MSNFAIFAVRSLPLGSHQRPTHAAVVAAAATAKRFAQTTSSLQTPTYDMVDSAGEQTQHQAGGQRRESGPTWVMRRGESGVPAECPAVRPAEKQARRRRAGAARSSFLRRLDAFASLPAVFSPPLRPRLPFSSHEVLCRRSFSRRSCHRCSCPARDPGSWWPGPLVGCVFYLPLPRSTR